MRILLLYFALFIGVMSISTSGILVKIANAPSAVAAFYRLFITSVILLPFILRKKNRQEISGLGKKEIMLLITSGFFLAMHYLLWFESLNYTSVASSTVIVTLQPLFSIVGCYFLFKEKLTRNALAGCFLAILGCVIIGWGDLKLSGTALLGDTMAFLAAGIITAHFFIGQHLRKYITVTNYSFLSYLSSSFFLGLYALINQMNFLDYTLVTWRAFFLLAIISTLFGQFIFNWLLKWFSTTTISMAIMCETLFAVLFAFIILDEVITLQQTIGICIILFGVSLFVINTSKKNKQ